MSFYVTLPSNSVSNDSENTTTNYTTNYKETIKLPGDYEVALVEAIYNLSWFLPVGSIVYSYSETDYRMFEVIPIILHDGDSIIKLIEKLNLRLQEHVLIKKYNERFRLYRENDIKNFKNKNNPEYKIIDLPQIYFPRSLYGTVNNLNVINDIKSNDKEYKQLPMLKYSNEDIFIQFANTFHTIEFKGKICEILKTNESVVFKGSQNDLNYIQVNTIEKINQFSLITLVGALYIYTDIIDYQLVGSGRIPLLRNIVLDYNASRKTTWVHYDQPHYLRVNQTEIRSILIDIRDDNGNKILFDSGSITIKLHFRPTQIKN